jgi:hypothetical protein
MLAKSYKDRHKLVETGLTLQRDMKSGSQRFRWNLLFNLLLWLIVPLPFWIPFVSNNLAYYLIPSVTEYDEWDHIVRIATLGLFQDVMRN